MVKQMPNQTDKNNILGDGIGFVRLVDNMGDDMSIVRAARVSYGKEVSDINRDKKLIAYLMTHKHTSPFEHVVFTFHMKMPIFVARQIVRHRTASINEISARYSQLDSDFYFPETLREQDTKNKQGSLFPEIEDEFSKNTHGCIESMIDICREAYEYYEHLLSRNVAREQARMILPLNIYTQWYWTNDLHNILHFLRLRLDPHAQYETRQYAKGILELIEPHVPITINLFKESLI